MALTKGDKDWIVLKFKEVLAETNEPIVKKVAEHEQMLRGVEGNNGMNSMVRAHNRFIWILTGGLALAGTTIFYELILK